MKGRVENKTTVKVKEPPVQKRRSKINPKKTVILGILFLVCYGFAHAQTFKNITVFRNNRAGQQKIMESIDNNGLVVIDSIKREVTVTAMDGSIILQGHSMKRIAPGRYRFHKYDANKSDFEIEINSDEILLYTHLAFWFTGYKYTIVLKKEDMHLVSER